MIYDYKYKIDMPLETIQGFTINKTCCVVVDELYLPRSRDIAAGPEERPEKKNIIQIAVKLYKDEAKQGEDEKAFIAINDFNTLLQISVADNFFNDKNLKDAIDALVIPELEAKLNAVGKVTAI